MSKRLILILVCLMVFLYLPLNASAEGYIISGNGYNYPVEGVIGSLEIGVNSETLRGSLRYFFPDMHFASTSITGVIVSGDTVNITGEGKIAGISGYTFKATIIDGTPDEIALEINSPDGSPYFQAEQKRISKGNYKITAQ